MLCNNKILYVHIDEFEWLVVGETLALGANDLRGRLDPLMESERV